MLKKYYHKQMQKERELTKIEQNNNWTKNDIIEPNFNKSYYDDVPENKDDYVIERTKFYSKLVKLFTDVKNAELAVEDVVIKYGFDPDDTDDMYDFFKMIDRKLAKEEKREEKLKKTLKFTYSTFHLNYIDI